MFHYCCVLVVYMETKRIQTGSWTSAPLKTEGEPGNSYTHSPEASAHFSNNSYAVEQRIYSDNEAPNILNGCLIRYPEWAPYLTLHQREACTGGAKGTSKHLTAQNKQNQIVFHWRMQLDKVIAVKTLFFYVSNDHKEDKIWIFNILYKTNRNSLFVGPHVQKYNYKCFTTI